MSRIITTGLLLLACVGLVAVPMMAGAKDAPAVPLNTITPAGGGPWAAAVAMSPPLLFGATHAAPPAGTPIATSDGIPSPLAGFPTEGPTFGILSTGNALFADDPNSNGWTGAHNGGGVHHGAIERDVAGVRLDLQPNPDLFTGKSCVAFDFRFLTEEYPEWVGSRYNDTFLAEVEGDTWTTSLPHKVNAPRNFARDEFGNTISVNTAGAASVTAPKAAGTTYDGATSLLRAQTVTADANHDGRLSLYLTVFDMGDNIYDSAVFVDRVKVAPYTWWGCESGMKGIDYDLDLSLQGQLYLASQSVELQAFAHTKEGEAIAGAKGDVTVSYVLAEETDAAAPKVACKLWSGETVTNSSGFATLKIPAASTLGCIGQPKGLAGKYFVTASFHAQYLGGEAELYGEATGGYVVE